ncbi:hypothetical protein DXG01_008892 [Tephrocybe rancida]|nr:hypothetical protein DXG01_008892 [Tephrocybe rancida]
MQHLLEHPVDGIPNPPKKPVALVLSPLIELGNSQVREVEEIGMCAIALNAETLTAASKEGRNLYQEIAACNWPIVFLSAEHLVSTDFNAVVRDDIFRENIAVLGIDESHILVPWSVDFRQAYQQVPLLKKRLPDHVALVVITATLAPGPEKALCRALKLKDGTYHTLRLSCECPNVQTVILELGHTLANLTFPAIEWVFRTPRIKAVVYCRTLELVYCVTRYGWSFFPPTEEGPSHVRMWSALTSPRHNRDTLEGFKDEASIQVIVTTIGFGMGMNLKNIKYSINLGIPDSCDALFQQNGQAGDLVGITYIEPAVYSVLKEAVEQEAEEEEDDTEKTSRVTVMIDNLLTPAPSNRTKSTQTPAKSAKGKKKGRPQKKKKGVVDMPLDVRWVRGEKSLEQNLARLLLASVREDCLIVEQNDIYSNPGKSADVVCKEAPRPLPCSSCEPFTPPTLDSTHSPPTSSLLSTQPPVASTDNNPAAAVPPLSAPLRAHARNKLLQFGLTRWLTKDRDRFEYVPHVHYWPTNVLNALLDAFPSIQTPEDCNEILTGWEFEVENGADAFTLIESLNTCYKRRIARMKVIQVRKAAATRAKNTAAKRASQATTTANAAKENVPPPPQHQTSNTSVPPAHQQHQIMGCLSTYTNASTSYPALAAPSPVQMQLSFSERLH